MNIFFQYHPAECNMVSPNYLQLKKIYWSLVPRVCYLTLLVPYIHPLIDHFRFHHFSTFAIINAIEQHCFITQSIFLRSTHYGLSHKGSKLLKSAKNKFTWQCDFMIFSSKFQQICRIFVSCYIFENRNQKYQEGVSSKTHYYVSGPGMDIIQCRLLKTSRCVL